MKIIAKCALAAAACMPLTVPTIASAATTQSHFSTPSGLTSNAAGDVFVANSGSGRISEITPGLTISTVRLKLPVRAADSVAVDSTGNLFVSSAQGGVTEFSPMGAIVQGITANARQPSSIAVDQFDDLYIASPSGLALDDPDGNSLSSNIDPFYSFVDSVAIGGSTVYDFDPGAEDIANGSFALRDLTMQTGISGVGPSDDDPVGAACSPPPAPEIEGTCWIADATDDQVIQNTPGAAVAFALSYQPSGIAYVASKNRVLVADASQNAIDVYDADTFALLKTLH